MYQELTGSGKIEMNPPPETTKAQVEIWWDERAKTTTKVENNRPDIIIWRFDKQLCQIVEIPIPLDINLRKAYKEKQEKHITLITNMQRIYKGYRYELIIITVGAMGTIPKTLDDSPRKLNFDQDQIRSITERLQKAALIGTMKVCKAAMGM